MINPKDLKEACEIIENLIIVIAENADVHHRTIKNSKLHNPIEIDSFRDCPCRTCKRATLAIDEGKVLI